MRKSIPVLILLTLFGCELIVDIDVPFEHEQLTLNSVFHNDSLWTATLSLNHHILNSSPFERIENGLVVLYQNDLPIDTLTHQQNGVYQSNTGKPLQGNAYEIRASAEKYGSVAARSSIPLGAPITNVEIISSTTAEGFPSNTFRVKFKDDASMQNYYQIILEVESDYLDFQTGQPRTRRNRMAIESDDPATQSENTNSYDGILLKDIFFNGKEVEVSFKTPYYNVQNSGTILITLRTLSEDYYKYKTTEQLQENTSGDPFAQPVNVYNNIENGFGIFAGYSQSIASHGNAKPIIKSISPLKGKPGDHVTITGENFELNNFNFSVIFTGIQRPARAQLVKITDSEIEVIIPQDAVTGKIYVLNAGTIGISEAEFEVIH
jgi:hypothetical protein